MGDEKTRGGDRARTGRATQRDTTLPRRSARALIGIAFAVTSAFAQAQTEFEVVSVRPARIGVTGGEGSGRESVVITQTGVTLNHASLSFCDQWAYNVRFYQVSGPHELTRDRYD